MKQILTGTLAMIVLAGTALAAPTERTAKEAATPAPVRVKNIEIEAELLKGELPAPDGHNLTGRTAPAQGSLISTRADFVPEIVRSAQDL